jgi:hypothetical protein
MAILLCGADAGEIHEALTDALLTDDEMVETDQWTAYPDPFGEWHEDPCTDPSDTPADGTMHDTNEGGRP